MSTSLQPRPPSAAGLPEAEGNGSRVSGGSAEEAQGGVREVSVTFDPCAYGARCRAAHPKASPAGRRRSCRRSWTGSGRTASARPKAATRTRLKCRNAPLMFCSDGFDVLLVFDRSLSFSRELNEINRKHIQDSVALIRKVRSAHSRG